MAEKLNKEDDMQNTEIVKNMIKNDEQDVAIEKGAKEDDMQNTEILKNMIKNDEQDKAIASITKKSAAVKKQNDKKNEEQDKTIKNLVEANALKEKQDDEKFAKNDVVDAAQSKKIAALEKLTLRLAVLGCVSAILSAAAVVISIIK